MRRTNDTAQPRTDAAMKRPAEGGLVDHASMGDFERRWMSIQSDFVEDPRRAVAEARKLVAELMDHVVKNLRAVRSDRDSGREGEMDTEAMRHEMHRYRGLMHRVMRGDNEVSAPVTTTPMAQPRVEQGPRRND